MQGGVVATYLHGPCLAAIRSSRDHLLDRASSANWRRWRSTRWHSCAANASPHPAASRPRLVSPKRTYGREVRVKCAILSISAPPAAKPCLVHPPEDLGFSVLRDDSDNVPPALRDLRCPPRVLDVLRPVGAMLVAVVLDRQLHVAPPHIEKCKRHRASSRTGNLRLRNRKPIVDQQQSQRALLWGCSTWIDQWKQFAQLTHSTDRSVALHRASRPHRRKTARRASTRPTGQWQLSASDSAPDQRPSAPTSSPEGRVTAVIIVVGHAVHPTTPARLAPLVRQQDFDRFGVVDPRRSVRAPRRPHRRSRPARSGCQPSSDRPVTQSSALPVSGT